MLDRDPDVFHGYIVMMVKVSFTNSMSCACLCFVMGKIHITKGDEGK